MITSEQIGARLCETLRHSTMTQTELAARLGITQSPWRTTCAGIRCPRSKRLPTCAPFLTRTLPTSCACKATEAPRPPIKTARPSRRFCGGLFGSSPPPRDACARTDAPHKISSARKSTTGEASFGFSRFLFQFQFFRSKQRIVQKFQNGHAESLCDHHDRAQRHGLIASVENARHASVLNMRILFQAVLRHIFLLQQISDPLRHHVVYGHSIPLCRFICIECSKIFSKIYVGIPSYILLFGRGLCIMVKNSDEDAP